MPSFIGRRQDLARLVALLGNAKSRLLTLLGPGGIGKSRVAVEAAAQAGEFFEEGAYIIDFRSIEPGNFLAYIIDALPYPATGSPATADRLIDSLRRQRLLLVLDNFDRFHEQAPFLSRLLREAPGVKALVTSRETLRLQEEWLHPLRGLPFPFEREPENILEYDAVQLFLARVYQVQPDFDLEQEQDGMIRICQQVDGNPLALEMAASWTKIMTCASIADEIEKSIAFLSMHQRNVAECHRSMEAVLDQSWRRLEPEERTVMERLSVFSGYFEADTAYQVAGATLSMLLSLVDKSLLQSQDDRFKIGRLQRRYAREKLARNPADAILVERLHRTYGDESLSRGKENDSLRGPQIGEEKAGTNNLLTPRELEVLELLAKGLTNRQIAEELTVVEGTVKAHNHSIYNKIGVSNRTEAVIRALEYGLI